MLFFPTTLVRLAIYPSGGIAMLGSLAPGLAFVHQHILLFWVYSSCVHHVMLISHAKDEPLPTFPDRRKRCSHMLLASPASR